MIFTKKDLFTYGLIGAGMLSNWFPVHIQDVPNRNSKLRTEVPSENVSENPFSKPTQPIPILAKKTNTSVPSEVASKPAKYFEPLSEETIIKEFGGRADPKTVKSYGSLTELANEIVSTGKAFAPIIGADGKIYDLVLIDGKLVLVEKGPNWTGYLGSSLASNGLGNKYIRPHEVAWDPYCDTPENRKKKGIVDESNDVALAQHQNGKTATGNQTPGNQSRGNQASGNPPKVNPDPSAEAKYYIAGFHVQLKDRFKNIIADRFVPTDKDDPYACKRYSINFLTMLPDNQSDGANIKYLLVSAKNPNGAESDFRIIEVPRPPENLQMADAK